MPPPRLLRPLLRSAAGAALLVLGVSNQRAAPAVDDLAREIRQRHESVAAKERRLLELIEQLVRCVDELERATKTLAQLDPSRHREVSPQEKARQAAETLRVAFEFETLRQNTSRLITDARRAVDALRPGSGGRIQIGGKTILVPATAGDSPSPK